VFERCPGGERTPTTILEEELTEANQNGSVPRSASDYEREFFASLDGGAPVPDDYVDPDLERLGGDPGHAQVIMLGMLAAFAIFLATQYLGELRYYFSPTEPIDLGEIDEISLRDDLFEEGMLTLPSNRYVSLVGITERRSHARKRIFYKLVGAHIYVQSDEVDERPRILRHESLTVSPTEESYRAIHETPGRLIAFEDLPGRYQGVVRHYGDNYRTHFCGYEPSAEVRAYMLATRGRVEMTLLDELGRPPTPEELDDRLGPTNRCQHGYLVISGMAPRDYAYVLYIYAALGLVLIGCLVFMVRWFRASRAAGKD